MLNKSGISRSAMGYGEVQRGLVGVRYDNGVNNSCITMGKVAKRPKFEKYTEANILLP